MAGNSSQLNKLEKLIIHDRKFLFTLSSYVVILAIYVNLNTSRSSVAGIVASILYFLINGSFLGHVFFEKETTFFRLVFGILLLIMLLGFVGWVVMIIYNLDFPRFTLVLLVATTLSSLMNKRVKNKNAT